MKNIYQLSLLAFFLYLTPVFAAETTTSDIWSFFDAFAQCNTLAGDTIKYTNPQLTAVLSADPTSYCTLTVTPTGVDSSGAALPSTTCPLSAADVAQFTGSQTTQIFQSIKSGQYTYQQQFETIIKPLTDCEQKANIKYKAPPSKTIGPSPPAGATPVGSPIVLPPGMQAAPQQ